ncbi:hypothetical protein BGW80DRAFT_1290117 [Lactifluus volemus]|nr:hypothetical protein BGW80DRAFT_1290117 [Lactifluus volemus]
MCGRFALALQADEVEQLDGYPALRVDQWVHRDRYVPRYNPDGPALVMHSMRWGLVPHWSKAEPPTLNTINARAENLEDGGGMWASVKGRKRCVVVAQGYYEWLKKGTQRVPHFMRHKDQRLMLFAGLYDSATLEGQSEPLWTFTIVTTAASSGLAWLHDRQPVILTSQDALDQWLDTSTQTWDSKLNRLFDPYCDPDAPLECWKVGAESPTFIEPVQKRKDGIEAMFMRQSKAQKSEPEPPSLSVDIAPPEKSAKRKRERSPGKSPKPETVENVDTDSDVEILPDPLQSSPTSPSKVKKEKGDVSQSSSQEPQTTSPRKKQEKSESSSNSTPKITSFFAKT